MTQPLSEMVEEVMTTTKAIRKQLAGRTDGVQGTILAHLVSDWIVEAGGTSERAARLRVWLKTVIELLAARLNEEDT